MLEKFVAEESKPELLHLLPLNQALFLVDEEVFKEFMDALDCPPVENTKLRKLLNQKALWEL